MDLPPGKLPALPGLVAGRYRPVREVGRGGFGVVYEALDLERGRRVALKRLLPARLSEPSTRVRFDEETRVLALLRHPGIVRFLDAGHDGGSPFLVTEFVDGEDLRRRMDRVRGDDPAGAGLEAVDLVRQIAEALSHAHCFTAHLDLKPENVLVRGDGTTVLLDFGLARISDFRAQGRRCLGSAYYIAPEILAGEDVSGWKADVFSLGVVFYEMLMGALPVGVRPWPGRLIPGSGEALDRILARALDPAPAQRFRNVFDFRAALCLAFPGRAPAEEELALARRRSRAGDPEALLWLAALLEATGQNEDAQARYKAAARAGRGTPAEAMARECLGYPRKKTLRFCIFCGTPLPAGSRSSLCPDCFGGARPKPWAPVSAPRDDSALLRGPRGGAAVLRFSPDGGLLVAAGEEGEIVLASPAPSAGPAAPGTPGGGAGEWAVVARGVLAPGIRDADCLSGGRARVLIAGGDRLSLLEPRGKSLSVLWTGPGGDGAGRMPDGGGASNPSACCLETAATAWFGDRSGDLVRCHLRGEGHRERIGALGAPVLALRRTAGGDVLALAADGAWMLAGKAGVSAKGVAPGVRRIKCAALAGAVPVAVALGDSGAMRFAAGGERGPEVFPADPRPTAVAVDPGGKWFALGDERGGVRIFGESGKPEGEVRLDRNPVGAIGISPDGTCLAASTLGGGIWVFRTEDLPGAAAKSSFQ
jgi:hypothetical protein